MTISRDEAVAAIVATGKTVEQAEAFLAVLGSGFRRRGWVQGDPLSRAAIDENMKIFSLDAMPSLIIIDDPSPVEPMSSEMRERINAWARCKCGHLWLNHDVMEYRGDGSEMCCVSGCDQVGCPGRDTHPL